MFGFIVDNKLTNDQIRNKLTGLKCSDGSTLSSEKIAQAIEYFWYLDPYDSLISIPAFFEVLELYLRHGQHNGPLRYCYYNFLFNHISDGPENVDLEKIAISLELLETNELPLDEFNSLCAGLSIVTQAQGLTDKGILRQRYVEDSETYRLGFVHHTLQEFLAARYLLGRSTLLDVLNSFLVVRQGGMVSLKPSWYGVLRFLMESDKSHVVNRWLIELVDDNPAIIDEGFVNCTLAVDPACMTSTFRGRFFDLAYDTYQAKLVWLPIWGAKRIGLFAEKRHLAKLRGDVVKGSDGVTETFVRQGNVATVVDSLLEIKSVLLDEDELKFWREQLIVFANDGNANGVLQRNALGALEHFRDPSIVKLVQKAFYHSDRLVREAFIGFCTRVAPNDPDTIKFIVQAMKTGSDILGRYGLYEIKSETGLKCLLKHLASDKDFLYAFLDRESVFTDSGNPKDRVITDRIREVADEEVIGLCKLVINTAHQIDRLYHPADRFFIRELALLVSEHHSGYALELLSSVKRKKNRERSFYDYVELIILVLNPNDLDVFIDRVKAISEHALRIADNALYRSQLSNRPLYDAAIERDLIRPVQDDEKAARLATQSSEVCKSFLKLLTPSSGLYITSVFKYFVQNHEILTKCLSRKDLSKFRKLLLDTLNKLDPALAQVKIDTSERDSTSYKISGYVAYFGDVLRAGLIVLDRKAIEEVRAKIISLVPYAFTEDQELIKQTIPSLSDDEISGINKKYLNKHSDTRYFLPSSYIYLIQHYLKAGCSLPSAGPVLQSFIDDAKLATNDRVAALEAYGHLINDSSSDARIMLEKIVAGEKSATVPPALREAANSILITVYRDDAAIDWRFNEIKKRLAPHEEVTEVHWVGPLESELHELKFAKPLISLKSPEYLPKFLDLLDFSFGLMSEADRNRWQAYINYIWTIVIRFVDSLKEQGSFEPLISLEQFIKGRNQQGDKNWLLARVEGLRQSYVQAIGRAKSLADILERINGGVK